MDESNGVNDEGFEGLCSLRGMAKGSMVEGYVLEETLGFVTEYLHEFQHVSSRVWDVDEGVFREVLEGAPTKIILSPILGSFSHACVLTTTEVMGMWI